MDKTLFSYFEVYRIKLMWQLSLAKHFKNQRRAACVQAAARCKGVKLINPGNPESEADVSEVRSDHDAIRRPHPPLGKAPRTTAKDTIFP